MRGVDGGPGTGVAEPAASKAWSASWAHSAAYRATTRRSSSVSAMSTWPAGGADGSGARVPDPLICRPRARRGVDVDGQTWTWDYFLVPQNQPTPAASAMGMFSPLHLGVLALLAAGTVLLVGRYRVTDPTGRRRLRLTVALTLLGLEPDASSATSWPGRTPPRSPRCTSAGSRSSSSWSTRSSPTAGRVAFSTRWRGGVRWPRMCSPTGPTGRCSTSSRGKASPPTR